MPGLRQGIPIQTPAANAYSIPSRMAFTFPLPPHSTTKRPPAFSARKTPAITLSRCTIQCRAAFEKTASNSDSNVSASAFITRASTPRAFAAATSSREESTPDNLTPHQNHLLRQIPVPTAYIQNPLMKLRCQKPKHRHPQLGNKTRLFGIRIRIPRLHQF